MQNTRRFLTEDKVDVIVGSAATPVAAAMADVAAEGKTVQLMLSPVNLPPGKGEWSFRMPQSTAVMAIPIVEHWKKTGVKTYGFLGYADAYGEAWLTDIRPLAEKAGIKLVDTERFARTDTSVTGQALKLISANPDAILVVASGSGAAMPHKGLVERGYPKAKIYQTHGAATMDLIRVGGADVEGSFVSSGPAVVAEKLPDEQRQQGARHEVHRRVREGQRQGHRPTSSRRTPSTSCIVLQKAVPIALKKGKPGTPEFRAAPEGSVRDDGPHAGLAGRAELDRDRPLRLHAGDRRAAEGRQRRLAGRAELILSRLTRPALPRRPVTIALPHGLSRSPASCCSTASPTAPSTRCWRSRSCWSSRSRASSSSRRASSSPTAR